MSDGNALPKEDVERLRRIALEGRGFYEDAAAQLGGTPEFHAALVAKALATQLPPVRRCLSPVCDGDGMIRELPRGYAVLAVCAPDRYGERCEPCIGNLIDHLRRRASGGQR